MNRGIRYLFNTVLGLTLGAQIVEAQTPAAKIETGPGDDVTASAAVTTTMSSSQVTLANKTMLKMAQGNFLELANKSGTFYQKKLDVITDDINADLERFPDARYTEVVVLNHHKFMTGIALGLTPEETLKQLLREQNIRPRDVNFEGVLESMTAPYKLPDGADSYTTAPAVYGVRQDFGDKNTRIAVFIPPSEMAPGDIIPGLTEKQTYDYIFQHEKAHIFINAYTLQGYNPVDVMNLDWNKPSSISGIEKGYELAGILTRQESLANIVGAMMCIKLDREITDASIYLNTLAAYSSLSDPEHRSGAVLGGLAQYLEEEHISVKKIKKMNVSEILEICKGVNEEYGLSTLAANAALVSMYGDENEVARLHQRAVNETEIKKGIDFGQLLKQKPNFEKPKNLISSVFTGYAANWNAADTLQNTAALNYSFVSPATMVQAYGNVMDSLYSKDPNGFPSDVTRSQASQLMASYIKLPTFSFAAANIKNGFDNLSVPGLQQAMTNAGGTAVLSTNPAKTN